MQKYFDSNHAHKYIRILRSGAGITNFDRLEENRAIYLDAPCERDSDARHGAGCRIYRVIRLL
jgi:hypothetical protein